MRTRKEIEDKFRELEGCLLYKVFQIEIELLLDIRDLLIEEKNARVQPLSTGGQYIQ